MQQKNNNLNLNSIFKEASKYFNDNQFNKAIELCDTIIDLDKNHYQTWNLLGNIFMRLNDANRAKDFFITSLKIKPDFLEAYHMLGNLLFKENLFQDAINIWKEVLKYNSSYAIIYSNISSAYIALKEFKNALFFANKSLEIDPEWEDGYIALSNIYKNQMNLKKMKENIKKALLINPVNPHTNFDLSYIYFIEKKYKEAFKHFEYRRELPNMRKNYNFMPFKEYNYEPLDNKSLLIYHEQGFGDNIQFARFLNTFQDIKISYGIQNSLNKLFSYNFPHISFKKEINCDEKFDFMIPIMSIPKYFNIYEIHNYPYLKVKDEDIDSFKKRYMDKNKFNIGIVWRGSETSNIKQVKNLSLNDFKELFTEDRCFYSLQVGDNEELNTFKNIKNLGVNFKDFYDTAVAISALDLIISIDTAIAHLTGALGKKGLILSNSIQFDWRWENINKKSIWYKSLKVFKYTSIKGTIKELNREIDINLNKV